MPTSWRNFLRQKFIWKTKREKQADPLCKMLFRMLIILKKVRGDDFKDDKGILAKLITGNISEGTWKLINNLVS